MSISHTVPPDLIETKGIDHLVLACNGTYRSSYLGVNYAGSDFRSRVVFSGDCLSWLSTIDLLFLLAAGPDTRPGLGV